MQTFDVVIVGARIAGATVALRLGEAGARVLLVDKSRLPSPVVSSSFLWPPTVGRLDQLGVLEDVERGLPRLQTWLKFRDDVVIEGRPPWTGSHPYGLSPNRLQLDAALLRKALATGNVEFWCPAPVDRLLLDEGRVSGIIATRDGREWRAGASWIVGADGRHSRVVRCVQPRVLHAYPPYRAWFVAHLEGWAGAPDQVVTGTQGADWFGISSTHGGEVIASLSVPLTALPSFRGRTREEFWSRLQGVPSVAARLERASIVGTVRGAADLGGWVRQAVGHGWLLAGDANAHVDPITATGIGFGIVGAEALACALLNLNDDALTDYEQQRNALYAPVFEATRVPPPSEPQASLSRDGAAPPAMVADEHFAGIVRAVTAWFEGGPA